jgi:phage N-6-adenine-methyltransferase
MQVNGAVRSMGSHQSSAMLTDCWLTPPEIIKALGPFDLDPCASPEPRPWPTATKHITLPADGLAKPWTGRVWLNPPYSREAVRWLRRMSEHGQGTALMFARTETSWFRETVWHSPTASGMLFLDGRVYFHRPDGTKAGDNAGAPSVLVAYGMNDAEKLRTSGIPGYYVRSWELADAG